MVSLPNHEVGHFDRTTTPSFDRLWMRSTDQSNTQECSVVQGGKLATDILIAEELGADAFVTKPYANAEVVGAVRQLLGGSGGSA